MPRKKKVEEKKPVLVDDAESIVEAAEEYDASKIKLSKPLKQAATQLDARQVKYLVSLYYRRQEDRIRAAHHARIDGATNPVVLFTQDHAHKLEQSLKLAMQYYADSHPAGRWMLGLYGIGPVIAAGMLAHIDVTKTKSAGSVHRYAGLDATVKHDGRKAALDFLTKHEEDYDDIHDLLKFCAEQKGRTFDTLLHDATHDGRGGERPLNVQNIGKALARLPWNAKLKTLAWKAGQSFKMFSKQPECYYGSLYVKRKALEVSRNLNGDFADQAHAILAKRNFRSDTVARKAYEQGRLPDAHIDARACRATVKLFLCHLWEVMYECHYHAKPPMPYVFKFMGHDEEHYIPPPGWKGV